MTPNPTIQESRSPMRYKTTSGIRGIYGPRLFVESTHDVPLPASSEAISKGSMWGGVTARSKNWVAWEFGDEDALARAISFVESSWYVCDNSFWEDP